MAADEKPDPIEVLKRRVKQEYRRVWDEEYDREEAQRNQVPQGKAHPRTKRRKRRGAKKPQARKANRKILLIRDAVE